jgi:hypothetical protein
VDLELTTQTADIARRKLNYTPVHNVLIIAQTGMIGVIAVIVRGAIYIRRRTTDHRNIFKKSRIIPKLSSGLNLLANRT